MDAHDIAMVASLARGIVLEREEERRSQGIVDAFQQVESDSGESVFEYQGREDLGGGGTQLDHSFLPHPSTTEDVWFDVTGGFVLFDGAWEPVDAFTIAEDETDTHWWLEIDDASETVDITVESDDAWPTAEGLKFIRLFEFGEAGVLSSITRHATNDVVWAGDDIRGTEGLFKAVTDRAYLTADDTLVSEDTAFDSETMYLYKTWDYIRWPEPES
jgi:hypothetical protein